MAARTLTDDEKRLCKVALAHAILRSKTPSTLETSDAQIGEKLAAWRPLPKKDTLRELEAMAGLPLSESPALQARFVVVAQDARQEVPPDAIATWIPVRGWHLLDHGTDDVFRNTMNSLEVLARIHPFFGPPVLCGLHALASRLALDLVDRNDGLIRLIARAKPLLDTFASVVTYMALSMTSKMPSPSTTTRITATKKKKKKIKKKKTDHHSPDASSPVVVKKHPITARSDDALALAEMLARLVLDFEHVPLAHAHLVLLSEQVLPLLTT